MAPDPWIRYRHKTSLLNALLVHLPALAKERKLIRQAEQDAEFYQEFRDQRLAGLVQHAHARTRYYHQAFSAQVVADFRGAGDLPLLPLLNRRELQQNFAELVAKGVTRQDCSAYTTSGSTGEPVKVLKDVNAIHYYHLVIKRVAAPLGLRFRPGQPSVIHLMNTEAPKTEICPYLNFSRYYRFGLGAPAWQEARAPLQFLSAIKGGFVLSASPHMLQLLMEHIQQHDPQRELRCAPGVVLSGGAPLLPALRRAVGEFFSCPVVDIYASVELGPMAISCPAGDGFHLDGLACVMECLDEQGQPLPAGQLGELVATSLHDLCLPLIRYRLGDMGTLLEGPCACGSAFPKIALTLTRGGVTFTRRDGSRLVPAFFSYSLAQLPLLQFQVEQQNIESFVLRYVPVPGADVREVEQGGRAVFIKHLGEGIQLTCQACAVLGTPGEKFKPYVNRLHDS